MENIYKLCEQNKQHIDQITKLLEKYDDKDPGKVANIAEKYVIRNLMGIEPMYSDQFEKLCRLTFRPYFWRAASYSDAKAEWQKRF